MTGDVQDPLDVFRARLQELFVLTRRPTYRSLEAHARLDHRVLRPSTISGLLNGPGTPRWSTVEAFVRACAVHARAHRITVDPGLLDMDRWHRDYRTLENALADDAAYRERVAGRPVPARRGLTVPAQLPADPPAFTGRTEHLAQLAKLFSEEKTAVIDGTAGVGKTALAVHWAHQIRDQFPDGQLYVNLRGFDESGQVVDPGTAVRSFLDALNVPSNRIPVDRDAQAALYRTLLAGKRMLILLDNARDTAQVRPLLPGDSSCLVLVTSRNQLTGLVAAYGAQPVTLGLLTPGESRDLLARRLGAERVAAEPEAVEQIIARCARLPLALALVAAHAALQPATSLETLAGQLRDSQDRWQALAGDDPSTDAQAVFSWSYEALSPDAATLFRLLGLLTGPDVATAAAASLVPNPALTELTRANLLSERAPGRYALHDLLRAYAADRTRALDPSPVRRAAVERVLDHYLHATHTASQLLNPSRDPVIIGPAVPGAVPVELTDLQQGLGWLESEVANLLAAVALAAAEEFDLHVCQLTDVLWTFLDRRGSWHENAAVQIIALTSAARLGDPARRARAHRLLADSYIRLTRFDDAQIQLGHALDMQKQLEDEAAQAHTHLDLAMLEERQGRHEEALSHAEQSLELFRATRGVNWQARVLNAVGWIESQLGRHHDALAHCTEALTLLHDIGDRHAQAATLDSLGYIYDQLDDLPQALECYGKALELRQGDRYEAASTLTRLGDTHRKAGDAEAARAAYTRALDILTALNHADADPVRLKLQSL